MTLNITHVMKIEHLNFIKISQLTKSTALGNIYRPFIL
jgi:hypothetical protein